MLNQQCSPIKSKGQRKKLQPVHIFLKPEAPLMLFYVDYSQLRSMVFSNTMSTG